MPNAVEFSHRMTFDDYRRAYRYRLKYRERHPFYRVMLVFALVAVAYSLFRIMSGSFGPIEIFLLVWGIFWMVVRRPINHAFLSRRYKERWEGGSEDHMRFSEDGMEYKGEEGEGTLNWTGILRAIETKDGFMLIPKSDIFLWIPFSALDDERDRVNLCNMIRSYVSEYVQLR